MPVVFVIISLSAIVPAAALGRRFWTRRRRAAFTASWIEDASALSDETHSLVQLVLTVTVQAHRLTDSPLWSVVHQQFARLSQWSRELHGAAPSRGTSSALMVVRRDLVALEHEIARRPSRPRIRTDAATEPEPFAADGQLLVRACAEQLAVTATFLAIAVREDAS